MALALAVASIPVASASSVLCTGTTTSPPTTHASLKFSFPRQTREGGICPAISPNVLQEAAGPKWRARVSFFPSFLNNKKAKSREALKDELLDAIAPLDRGADATPQDQERIDQIARDLEAVNSIKEPLNSNLLNGKWELLYTTSRSILGSQRPKFLRPNGKIYQAINADTLRAQNMETWPFFNQAGVLHRSRLRRGDQTLLVDSKVRGRKELKHRTKRTPEISEAHFDWEIELRWWIPEVSWNVQRMKTRAS